MSLTIVVTAHHARFLTESMMSIASQSTKDFELVCIADVSESNEVLHCFRDCLPYVNCRSYKLISVHGNGTAGFVRNLGFSEASTEWVGYLDGDDLLHMNAVKVMANEINDLRKLEVEHRILCSGMIRIHGNGRLEPVIESLDYLPPINVYEVDPDLVGEPLFINQFQVIRKEHWHEYKFDETTNGEDIDYMLHHMLMGSFKKIPKFLYYYRYTTNSFSDQIYEGGDIVTQRYLKGYYIELFNQNYDAKYRSNFRP